MDMTQLLRTAVLTPLLFAVACSDGSAAAQRPRGAAPQPRIEAPATLAKDAFAINMFRDVVAEQQGNVVFSPASLEGMLGSLQEGARGTTLAAFQKLRMGQKCVKSAMQVESADALFIADDLQLKPVKVQDIRRTSFRKPSAAADAVNDWCSEKTHGLIPSILTPSDISAQTRMVVVNAVYLKEKWLRPFDKADTDNNGRFHTADGRTVTTPMMRQTGEFRYAEGEDWQAVALFYDTQGRDGEPGCFIGILPKGDAREFAATLTPEKYNAIRLALAKAPYEETRVSLPKMKVETPVFSLKGALSKNGLGVMFTDSANFTGFADEPLCVDNVLQRCYVRVDEEETEAAAVSAALMDCYGVMEPTRPHVINFDRPFIWVIGDLTTGAAPFFMGLFEKP